VTPGSAALIDQTGRSPMTTIAAVILYTCEMAKIGGSLPPPIAHPCGRAAKALDDAGVAYEHRMVKGGKFKLWTLPKRASDRAEIERLTGQQDVPVLIFDDGAVITGSGSIVAWAREHGQA
jgi:glutaredoxin